MNKLTLKENEMTFYLVLILFGATPQFNVVADFPDRKSCEYAKTQITNSTHTNYRNLIALSCIPKK